MAEVNDVLPERRVIAEDPATKQPLAITITRPNFLTEKAFSTFLETRQFQAFERRRGIMSEATYDRNLAVWQKDCAKNVWGWGKKDAVEAMLGDDEIFSELLFLIVSQSDQNVSRKQVETVFKARSSQCIDAYLAVMAPSPTTPPPAETGANT